NRPTRSYPMRKIFGFKLCDRGIGWLPASNAGPSWRRRRQSPTKSLFGAPLLTTRFAAYLPPGTGRRSLTTIIVPSDEVSFSFSRREGAPEPDIRVMLPVPPMGERLLIVKDHHLLRRAEESSSDPVRQIATLNTAVMQMGERVAVRLGLSRPFQSDARQPAMCWLMADGFF